MRTIKRETLAINAAKLSSLESLCLAYAKEKQYWLTAFQSFRFQALLGNYRKVRDECVKNGYQSVSGLQARHWKLALQDAMETWDKYWQALFVHIRFRISKRRFSESERRYAYFLIKAYEQFAQLMQGAVPEVAFEISKESKKQVAGFVRNLVKKRKGNPPSVKKARIIKFDANCYEVFEHEGRQYIKVMSLQKGKRLVLPLKGQTKILGNITLVLSEQNIEVHVSQELKLALNSFKTIEAVDFGFTEVMTDTQGIRYGKQFGNILTKKSDSEHVKMQKRNKLHALEKKIRSLHPQKARRIRRCNLGRQKLLKKHKKAKASLKCEINKAINQLIESTKPSILITENLSHLFTYDKSKALNRKLSSWLRGEIQDRIAFKALAEGFRHEMVNPAYGSQTCPCCDFVDRKNRRQDSFKCLYCGHEDLSDRVAAKNIARRYGDDCITLYTPYSEVKTILLDRFHRRLEAEQSATVPGRTLETVAEVNPPHCLKTIKVIAGKEQLTGRSIRERNKINTF